MDIMLTIGIAIGAIILFVLFRRMGEMRAPTVEQAAAPPVPPQPASWGGTPSSLAASGSESTRVAITHPLIRKAAKRALERGGEAAKYIFRDGDTVYFSFEALPDPDQRRRAVDLVRRCQGADTQDAVDMAELLAVMRQLFGK